MRDTPNAAFDGFQYAPIVTDRTRLGLLADEPAAAALRRRVRALQRALDRRLRGLSQRVDVRSVHEARIAARRLRVVLRSFASVLEPTVARAYRRAVAEVADVLQSVRDADVAVEQFDALIDHAEPAPAHARKRLIARRVRARRALRAALRTETWSARCAAMRAAAADPTLVGPSPERAGALA
ncbi:MAG: CHAD domain-containing protein, partial [Gammaproteobacteria bacterium]|nr:CHAD domain-containing protein [Gammaproteobacteria bacterium]